MKARWCIAVALCTACAVPDLSAAERRNWFGDPFFQISAALPGCPVPAGPFITEAERREQSHARAERGTSCWMAGDCAQPNAYAYDRGIAAALQAAVAVRHPAPHSSVWITVQRRIVFVEGCVDSEVDAAAMERFAASVPEVDRVVVAVAVARGSPPPYKLLTAP